MRRRDFIKLFGGAAVGWPVIARAQRSSKPVIGFLHTASPNGFANLTDAFRYGLKEVGYVENENCFIEYRWAEGQFDRLPAMVADLIDRKVAVIAALGGSSSPLIAHNATKSISIVFSSGEVDPVSSGLVASLGRPGGNVTGISPMTTTIIPKRLELLRQLVPRSITFGYLSNPNNPTIDTTSHEVNAAAQALGIKLIPVHASTEPEIDDAFANLAQKSPDALFVGNDPYYFAHRNQIVTLAASHSVPASYFSREFVAVGGLTSYAASFADAYRQAGNYVGRILKGESPANLPVIQSVKFDFAINLKTVKALGLTIPPQLIATADEVIE